MRGRSEQPEAGVTSIEFVALMPLVVLIGAIVWQLLITGAAATAVENAARDASRVAGRGGDAIAVRSQVDLSLPSWLRGDGIEVDTAGTRVTVSAPVPLVFPGVTLGDLTIRRSAELPATS